MTEKAKNRGYFEAKNISAFNLVSSPGSGKTTFSADTPSDNPIMIGQIQILDISDTEKTSEKIPV